MCAHTPGDGGGVIAGHAAANHHDHRRCHAGNPAHEHAAATLGAHQVVGADMGGQPPGHLAHRGQQGQRTIGGLHGFVGDRGGTRGQQGIRARTRRRQMQVGEQHLALAHPAVLRLDGLLDLQQQVRLGPHLVGGVDEPRASCGEVRVMDGRPLAGPGLD